MLRFGRLGKSTPTLGRHSATLVIAAVGVGLASCSTDFSRFEAPVLGYSGAVSGEPARPVASEATRYDQRQAADSRAPYAGYAPSNTTTPSNYGAPADSGRSAYPRMADAAPAGELTTASTRQPIQTGYATQSLNGSRDTGYRPSTPPPATSAPDRVTVRSGDTLYEIARRYGVRVADIKRANGLTSNIIRPGQQLALGGNGAAAVQPRRTAAAAPRFDSAPAASPRLGGADTYTVRAGDSLYAISRRTGVRVATLKSLNDIRDVRRVMPGTVLRLNDGSATAAPAVAAEPASSRITDPSPRITVTRTTTNPIILNPRDESRAAAPASGSASQSTGRAAPSSTRIDNPQRTAAAAPSRESAPAASGDIARPGAFRWPVKGRIVRGFGKRSDGTKNDGINIAVPVGTEIHAAEAGVVAYAGNELKGYGNLILVRHDNGYVTAYAHSDRMLVRRGDAVRRGQVIAKAGKTGSVAQPQLHFELRRGAKPVDPMPYLGRNF